MILGVFVVVEEVELKPRMMLPESMEKLGHQCDVSVKVCAASRGEVEVYEVYLEFSI